MKLDLGFILLLFAFTLLPVLLRPSQDHGKLIVGELTAFEKSSY